MWRADPWLRMRVGGWAEKEGQSGVGAAPAADDADDKKKTATAFSLLLALSPRAPTAAPGGRSCLPTRGREQAMEEVPEHPFSRPGK